ncbi:MAG: type II toxin-antitoxin system ParD family antitoxin [Gammaproteobacteria bacterium]|nr:type II toxin-antitoxin system ParD family antitoxin [Gammaproteobacteria bacterium]
MPAQHAKSIALTPELAQWIDDLVAKGEYKCASEVMRDGLRALQNRRKVQELELEEIRARISLSLNQAKAGNFAAGSGKESIHRAFETAVKDDNDPE